MLHTMQHEEEKQALIQDYLQLRKSNGNYHYRRRVPADVKDLFGKHEVYKSLRTKDPKIAESKAIKINDNLESLWDDLRINGGSLDEQKYQRAVKVARLNGFKYLTSKELEAKETEDLMLTLIARSEQFKDLPNRESIAKVGGKFDALFGGVEEPRLHLSDCYDKYVEFTKDQRFGLDERQAKKKLNPKKAALQNFINIVGDRLVSELKREHVLEFRSHLIDRLDEGEIIDNTFNKQFGHLRIIFRTIKETLQIDMDNETLFKNVTIKQAERKRISYDIDYVRDVLLDQGNFKTLNDEAYALIPIMASTGMRPSEVCGLDKEDIFLDAEVPYVHIRPKKDLKLKTPHSERKIPLAGSALWAFQKYPEGFKKYYRKSSSLSAALNKYMRENGLIQNKEGRHTTAYCLRHTFQDLLRMHKVDERLQCDLMGHKYERPKYGAPSLDEYYETVKTLAFDMHKDYS